MPLPLRVATVVGRTKEWRAFGSATSLTSASATAVTSAVLPAAGVASRLHPFSTLLPKAMMPIIDRTNNRVVPNLIDIIQALDDCDVNDIVCVVRECDVPVFESFWQANRGSMSVDLVRFVVQRRALGLSDALLVGATYTQSVPFLALLPDHVFHNTREAISTVQRAYVRESSSVLGVTSVSATECTTQALVLPAWGSPSTSGGDNLLRIAGVIEKPSINCVRAHVHESRADSKLLGPLGIDVVSHDLLEVMRSTGLELRDAQNELVQRGGLLWGATIDSGRADMGTADGYARALHYSAMRANSPMKNSLKINEFNVHHVHSFEVGGVARAEETVHARLDVMGGIADYSGARVLQARVSPAVHIVATQKLASGAGLGGVDLEFSLNGKDAQSECQRLSLTMPQVHSFDEQHEWYSLAVFLIQRAFKELAVPSGDLWHFDISTTIPLGSGLASSAALLVALWRSIHKASGITLEKIDMHKLSIIGQDVERRAGGLHCGAMDFFAVAECAPRSLLEIDCSVEPHRRELFHANGECMKLFAVGCGNRCVTSHTQRYKEVRERTERAWKSYTRSNKCARNVSHAACLDLPDGCESLDICLRHAIEEGDRCRIFSSLLHSLTSVKCEQSLRQMGALMLQSHRSYRRIGLSHEIADDIVKSLMEDGGEFGLYGARMSGGGGGGSVVVLAAAHVTVQDIYEYLENRCISPVFVIEAE